MTNADPPLPPLYSPARVRKILAQHGLKPTKSLGQNFLIDGNILRSIAEAGGANTNVPILEVGPGLGVLTHEMASRGAQVTSLEKDERLKPILKETLGDLPVKIIWGDALEFNYDDVPSGTRVIANLPYYITGPLLSRFMKAKNIISATVLVQKEVAQRLTSKPGQNNYGFLTALAQLYGTIKLVRDVPKGSFFPAPDVTSSVVRLDFDRAQNMPDPALIQFLDQTLAYRRKTLRNNLRMAGFTPESIDAAFISVGLRPDIRAEAVQLKDLKQLAVSLDVLN